MVGDTRPRLPGTLFGLLDAGTRLYHELQTSDELLEATLSTLARINRAMEAGGDMAALRFEIGDTLRVCSTGRGRLAATLRHFSP